MNQQGGSPWTKLGAAALGGAALGFVEGETSDIGEYEPGTDSFYDSQGAPFTEPASEPIPSFTPPAAAPADPNDTVIGQHMQLLNAQAFWGPLQTCASMPIG